MKVKKPSQFTDNTNQSLIKCLGNRLNNICFEYGYVTNIFKSRFVIYFQQASLQFKEFEVVILNDFHEISPGSEYHILHALERVKGPRSYNSLVHVDWLVSEVSIIEVWGNKHESDILDCERIRLNESDSFIIDSINAKGNQCMNTEHIINIILENGNSLIFKSESKNEIQLNLINAENQTNNWLNSEFNLWRRFIS